MIIRVSLIVEVGIMKKNLPITDNEVLFDSSSAIVSTTDLKGALTYINQDFLDISGFTSDELIGKIIILFVTQICQQLLLKIYGQQLNQANLGWGW